MDEVQSESDRKGWMELLNACTSMKGSVQQSNPEAIAQHEQHFAAVAAQASVGAAGGDPAAASPKARPSYVAGMLLESCGAVCLDPDAWMDTS